MGALLLLCCAAAQGSRTANSGGTAGPSDEPLAPLPPRLFYINDHAAKGCDPDNEQTLVHLLFHADLFSWEGLVGEGGTNCATRQGHLPPGRNAAEVLRVLSAYAADYPALRKGHAAAGLPGSFPSPKVLRSMVTQGVNVSAPDGLPPVATAASRALVKAARHRDTAGRPLWVVTGGSLSDVSRALHDAPDIVRKIRLYSIGSWNTAQDPASRRRVRRIPNLWWIEANSSFRGVYKGGNQTGQYNDITLVSDHIAKAVGSLYKRRSPTMKEGDMSGFYFLMGPPGANPEDPTAPHWGGRYRLVDPDGGAAGATTQPPSSGTLWGDLLNGTAAYPQYPGAQTVSRWRADILNLWLFRMAWVTPALSPAGPTGTPASTRAVSVDIVQLWWDYGGVKGGSDSPGKPADGKRAMMDAVAAGMTYFRFAATHFWPNEQRATYLASPIAEEDYWRKMDVLFADAEVLQVHLIPSLNWQIFLFPDLAGEPMHQMFASPSSKASKLLESYVTKFVTRYHNSSAVFAWELGNEYNLAIDLNYSAPGINMSGVAPSVGTPTHRTHEDNISTADLVAFQTRFAGWVRAADPKQRPISTGHATPRQGAWHLAQSYYAPQRDWGLDTEAQFTESVATQSAGCDIISYHYYGGTDNVRFGKTLGPPESAVLFPYLVSAAKAAGKQWYIGEFGSNTPIDRTFTLNMLDQLVAVKEGPVLATMWTWEWPTGQPNISVVPGRQGDMEVIAKIKAVNAQLKKAEDPHKNERTAIVDTNKHPTWKTDDDSQVGASTASACTTLLMSLCQSSHQPASRCSVCAGTHQSPLRAAGCSQTDITSWCSIAGAVRTDHPRIFFTNETIAATRANIAAHPDLSAVYHKLKARAMWDSVGEPSWNIQDHAGMMALPYLIETDVSVKASLFAKMITAMEALPTATTDEWTTGLTAWALAVMYDATFNDLSPAQRTKYAAGVAATADRVYTYYRHGDYNNHVYCEYGPLLYPGLALAHDGLQDDKAIRYLNFSADFLKNHGAPTSAQVGGTDGGWPEGRSYHALFIHWFTQQLWAWKIATGIDLFPATTGLRGDATWMAHTNRPHDNQPVAFADINTQPNNLKVASWDESFYYLPILAREYKDGIAQHASNASGFGKYEFRLWPYVIGHDPSVVPTPPSSLPSAALFEDLGWATMRSDWSSDATFAAFVCGRYFAGHQHHDQAHFVIHKQGTLAIDGGEYGARATECHNTILIGGNQRMNGMPNGGDPMRFVGDHKINPPNGQCYTGKILAYQHAPAEGWTYVAGDATMAYEATKVTQFVRQFVYLRPDLFVIYDRTSTVGPEQREWMLHSLEPAKISETGSVTVANGNGTLEAVMLYPSGVHVMQYQMTANNNASAGYDQQKKRDDNYIKFTPPTAPAGSQDFVTVIYARCSSSPPITSAKLTSTLAPGGDENWRGASVVIDSHVYEASFAPTGAARGFVRIDGERSDLPTTVVRTSASSSARKTDDTPGTPRTHDDGDGSCPDPAAARQMPCGLMQATNSTLAPSWPSSNDNEFRTQCVARGCCYIEDDQGCFFHGKPSATVGTVHLIMSSHLDIGYTAQPQDVINQAFDEHFPRAAGVGAALRARGGPERLRWMTHTYLVSLFLDCPPKMGLHCPNKTAIANFTTAVTEGDITWHAFPHNVETAAAGVGMIEAGVDLTRRVEKMLGQNASRTLSLRDVPGITRGAVPLLAELGVPYISVGANNNPYKANVPPAFRWKDPPSGKEALCLWHNLGYGSIPTSDKGDLRNLTILDADSEFGLQEAAVLRLPGLADVLVYAWRGDNGGPPASVEEVIATFAAAKQLVPTAKRVLASDLDTFLSLVDSTPAVHSQLPVVTTDLAEGWVYGAASDPIKQQQARVFARAYHRCRADAACAGSTIAQNFSRLAVKNAEHTWGVTNRYMEPCKRECNGTVCPNAEIGANQCNPDLAPTSGVPVDQLDWDNAGFHKVSFPHPLRKTNPYHLMVEAFTNQRKLGLGATLDALRQGPAAGGATLVKDVATELEAAQPRPLDTSGFTVLPLSKLSNLTAEVPWATVFALDVAAGGAISALHVRGSSHAWADSKHLLAQLRYETLDEKDMEGWRAAFLYENGTSVSKDYGKPNSKGVHFLESPSVTAAWLRRAPAGDTLTLLVELKFRSELHQRYGAPATAALEYTIHSTTPKIDVRFDMYNKTATRLPEACFVTFNPSHTTNGEAVGSGWMMDTLGSWIAPAEVADGAAKGLHGIDTGVRFTDGKHRLTMGSVDAALVRWGTPAPFPSPMLTPVDESEGASFLLWDNLYNTNYVLWWPFLTLHQDIAFRFSIDVSAPPSSATTLPVKADDGQARLGWDDTEWELSWSDEFEEAEVNASNWRVADGGTHGDELELYCKDEVFTRGGALVMRTRFNPHTCGVPQNRSADGPCGLSDGHYCCLPLGSVPTPGSKKTYNYTSGWLDTEGSFSQLYGRFAVRAKLPRIDAIGTWPAHWLLPDMNSEQCQGGKSWAGEDCCSPVGGEIDIMESYGNWRPEQYGNIFGTLHWGDNCGHDKHCGTAAWQAPCNYSKNKFSGRCPADGWDMAHPVDFSKDWHVYSVEWNATSVTWSFDGEQYWERHSNDRPGTNQSTVIPNKPMYVILNTAVQTGFPMQTNFSKDDVLHQVDWVRVWKKKTSQRSKTDDGDDRAACPCIPASLCRPLSPQPPKSRPEVFAYHGSEKAKPPNAWSAAGRFNNGSSWRTYDWDKVTSIGLFAAMDGAEGWDLLCTAHKHGVRVVPWSGAAWGQPNPIVEPYEAYRYQHKEVYSNFSYLDSNAKLSASFVAESGFDGILLDAEGLRPYATMPVGAYGRLRTGLVHWVSSLRVELDAVLEGSVLTWTVDSNATAADKIGKTYDFAGLNQHIDFFQPMEYCLSGDTPLAGRLPRRIYYTSRSNDPIWALNLTVQTFARLGVETNKLVMLLPWFGSDFTCAAKTNCDRLVWSARDPGWFGGQCGQALDGGPSLGQALALFANKTTLGHSLSTELSWDEASATAYFDWINTTKNHSGVSDGQRHQLWFDNAHSFGLKASMAIEKLGLHGIGIWLPELAATATQAAEMWGAIC